MMREEEGMGVTCSVRGGYSPKQSLTVSPLGDVLPPSGGSFSPAE